LPDFAFPFEKQGSKNGGKANPKTGQVLKAKQNHPIGRHRPLKTVGGAKSGVPCKASVSFGAFVVRQPVCHSRSGPNKKINPTAKAPCFF